MCFCNCITDVELCGNSMMVEDLGHQHEKQRIAEGLGADISKIVPSSEAFNLRLLQGNCLNEEWMSISQTQDTRGESVYMTCGKTTTLTLKTDGFNAQKQVSA